MTTPSQNNARNAAIVVASLDPSVADTLLDQMEPRQAALVRSLMMELDDVDPREEAAAIEAFFRTGGNAPAAMRPTEAVAKDDSGVELDLDFSRRAESTTPAAALPRSTMRSAISNSGTSDSDSSRPSFNCLHVADDEILLPFLLREHPQTAALVLAQLPPSRAADLLGQLADEMQTDVLKRLSHLDEASSSVLAEIERELETWIDAQLKDRRRRQQGLAAVKSIIDAAAPQAKQSLLSRLPADRLARPIKTIVSPPAAVEAEAEPELQISWLEFDDLVRLDDAALLAVYRQADPDWVVLALAGASPVLMTRLKKLLPVAEAKALDQAIASLGPTRLSDVEAAQGSMAEIASYFVARRRNRQTSADDSRELQTAG